LAIGRKLTEPIRVVSVSCDTAIDTERTPIYDYEVDRLPEQIVAITGETLTWWTIKPLPGVQADACRASPSPQRERLAASIAVVDCSDMSVLGATAWETVDGSRHLRADAMNALPDQLWLELGSIALQLGNLTVGEKQRFVPPAGLRVIRRPESGTTARSAENKTPASPGE
jgi:hypothetical protein